MAAFSIHLENGILNHVLRGGTAGTALAQPATVHVALFVQDAATAGNLEANSTVNEVTGGTYGRQQVTFDAPAAGATANTAGISFAGMPPVTVSHAAVMDAATGGNVLFYGALTAAKTLNDGDTFNIAAGDLDITLD